MDADVAGWILEFCLRQELLDDSILNKLVSVLPIPDHHLTLKKTLILRRIESETSKGKVSETILELLEYIEELDHREGIEVSEAMKAAYCAVAVDCTVRCLEGCEDDKWGKYFDAVKRIWRGRVREIDRWEIGLVSESLNGWNDEIEAGVFDLGVRKNLLVKRKSIDAVRLVRIYVNDAKEKIGPSFLELVAGTLGCDGMLQLLGYGKDAECDQVRDGEPATAQNAGHGMGCDHVREDQPTNACNAGDDMEPDKVREDEPMTAHNAGHDMECDQVQDREHMNVYNSSPDKVVNDSDIETHVDDLLSRSKFVGVRCKHVVRHSPGAAGTSRGFKIVDAEKTDEEILIKKYGGMPTPEVNKLQEALEASALDLQAVVKDPLPDALQVAESVISSMARENTASEVEHNRVDMDAPRSSVDVIANAPHANDSILDTNRSRDMDNGPKFNLMARNNTAHTIEWDDSMDSAVEGSPTRLHLPSPRKRVVTPLQGYQETKLTRRRKPRKWSTLEEDTLRTGVQKYGRGNWKLILSMYQDIFEDRTLVDLKDKWRNLTR